MTYQYEATPKHDEIAKHINKALGKRLSGEQVAMVMEGAKHFNATAKERAAEQREAKRIKKIADLKAQLAALGADEDDEEPVAPVVPIKKAVAKKAATSGATKPKGAAKKVAQSEKDRKKKVEDDESDISRTPDGAEPIEVLVEEDGFETVGGEAESDEDWDNAFEDGDSDEAEDF